MKPFHTHPANLTKLALLCLSLLLLPIQSYARDVSFEWTAVSEPTTGYKLYYKTGENSNPPYTGTGLTQGASPITITNSTTYTMSGLSPDETYHFVLTSYNDAGESGYSRIISILPSSDPRPLIINISSK